ncbi:MAG: hypothetical protein MJ094_09675 [Saccharofermentans sp.]|nr:hypothetical protein [Saccharofermentans sp.]
MRLVILGAGGYGRTVADVAEQLGYSEIVVLDDSIENMSLSSYVDYIDDNTCFIPAFGNNRFRFKWISDIKVAGGKLATLIHLSSYVSPKATVCEGVVILPKAVINTDVTIKDGCIINIGAMVDHGTVIEEGCHICCGAIVKGENVIPACTKVEAGAVIEARSIG